MKLRLIIGLSLIGFFTACSDSDSEEPKYESADYSVKGKVEKGPFVSGSTINLQPMDAKLQPNGSTFSTTITDHLGNFSFGTRTLEAPFAQLTANGYFFNEVKGRLSDGTLSLRAVVNVADASTVNVNILTHLKYQRIMNLVEKDGKSFTDANKQAQKELMAAFGLERLANTDVSKFSIAAGTDEAAALIAISSLILEDRSEAEVTEYLAKLSQEFGETGAFSVETKEQMRNDRADLRQELDMIESNVVKRYEELNQSVTVKPLERFFDWDEDGIAGNEFIDPNNLPTVSQTEFSVPKNGGEYTVDVKSSVPLYTEVQSLGGTDITSIWTEDFYETLYDSEESVTTITKEYKDGKLKITVGKTASRNTTEHQVCLYDYLGNTAATITLTQEGDPTIPLPKLGNTGKAVVSAIAQAISNAMYYRTFFVNDYENQKPLSASNTTVSEMWQHFYSAINRINSLSNADKQKRNAFEANIAVLYALCYYNMVTIWGDVPVMSFEQTSADNYNIPRTSQTEILATLKEGLETAINTLAEKKNTYDDADNFFEPSKDVARILLAHIYMYQGNYSGASTLLSQVKNNGYYSLAPASGSVLVQDEETIFGLKPSVGNTRSISAYNNVQALSFPDILLCLAECLNQEGNSSGALQILNDIESVKGLTSESTDVLHRIRDYRKQMNNMPGYFDFMKRAGLAKSEMGLQDYQLLFPIPSQEVMFNTAITQNPGY